MGFEQYLRHYVHIVSVQHYYEDRDRQVLDNVETLLDEYFGERTIDLIALESIINPQFSDIYAVIDLKLNPISDEFVVKLVKGVLSVIGVKQEIK